jgi:hypothetical protein
MLKRIESIANRRVFKIGLEWGVAESAGEGVCVQNVQNA